MNRRKALKLLGAASMVAGTSLTRDARAAEVVKLATLAPKSSPWGQVFTVWEKAVKEKSGGRVELQFFFNGQQGDEGAVVGKMKSGQLDGAFVSSVGLSKIYKPVLALQLPGLFTTWGKLDAARDALKDDHEKGIKDAGFKVVGWADIGAARTMSKGFPVRTPDDVKGKKPYLWRDSFIEPVLFQVIGGVTPVPLNVPEVLPSLNTGAIDIVTASMLAAEQLQWSSKLDMLVDDVSSCNVGGIVLASKRLEGLGPDLRAMVLDTGKVAAAALTKRIRNEDDAAFVRFKGKMQVVTLTTDEKAKWSAVYKQVRQRLAQGTFSPELVAKLETLAK